MRKMGYFIVFFVFISSFCFADEAKFGQYNYNRYVGLNQQLQYQRARTIRNQRMHYNQAPTRNLVIPRGATPGYYPNIERGYQRSGYSGRYRY